MSWNCPLRFVLLPPDVVDCNVTPTALAKETLSVQMCTLRFAVAGMIAVEPEAETVTGAEPMLGALHWAFADRLMRLSVRSKCLMCVVIKPAMLFFARPGERKNSTGRKLTAIRARAETLRQKTRALQQLGGKKAEARRYQLQKERSEQKRHRPFTASRKDSLIAPSGHSARRDRRAASISMP